MKEVSNMFGVLYLLENSIATMAESDVNEKDKMAAWQKTTREKRLSLRESLLYDLNIEKQATKK